MKLKRLTERIWVLPFEEERDRPNLGYIQGDHWSMAVDAGHAKAHTALFYQALEDSGLRLPALTVLTHWHWDHTFGMHAVHGLTAANEKTNAYLRFFREKLVREGTAFFRFRFLHGTRIPLFRNLGYPVFEDGVGTVDDEVPVPVEVCSYFLRIELLPVPSAVPFEILLTEKILPDPEGIAAVPVAVPAG